MLDTNVLIPADPRDTLLRAAEDSLFTPLWNPTILSELERNLVVLGMSDARRAANLIRVLQDVIPDSPVTGYEAYVDLVANHPRDRHVLAAAVYAKSSVSVTQDTRHFQPAAVEPWHIEVLSLDEFLSGLFLTDPPLMLTIVREQARDLLRPARSVEAVLHSLDFDAPPFVRMIRDHL